jgi:hypothetical protein
MKASTALSTEMSVSRFFVISTLLLTLMFVAALLLSFEAMAQTEEDKAEAHFIELVVSPDKEFNKTLASIEATWKPSYLALSLDVLSLAWEVKMRERLIDLMQRKKGQSFGEDMNGWYRWMWNQPEARHPHYAQFKSNLFKYIDPRFAGYFDDAREDTIRLDEVRWGGVKQDGIPPLRQPTMIAADEADYLEDSNVVFGVEINGDARAYPKRILAWHEMFVDEIGGMQFAGVYCTLCGAVILYETLHNGTQYNIGTSGFLYRSNKLMYDKTTQSLWSTTRGEPVIGPLVGKGIQLQRSYLVTTTWGEWKRRHPHTSVLSVKTGHSRNYREGVAYQQYFATDDLMFNVPNEDARLNNKDEILALTFPKLNDEKLAIHAAYLAGNPIYYDAMGEKKFVVLTDTSGANRVYQAGKVRFVEYDQAESVIDENGLKWALSESRLSSQQGDELQRLPAHRAFWFGWVAAHPDTRLIK